jgi:hypothetical protein
MTWILGSNLDTNGKIITSTNGNIKVDKVLETSAHISGSVQISGINFSAEKWDNHALPTLVAGKYLMSDGTNLSWYSGEIYQGTGSMGRLSDDTSPSLGGTLNISGFSIIGSGGTGVFCEGVSADLWDGYHLPTLDAGKYLSTTDGVNLSWQAGAAGIASVSADTSPSLGGDLDISGFSISGSGGTGVFCWGVSADKWDGYDLPALDANKYLTTDGTTLFWYSGAGGGGLSNIVEDETPELGGNLDGLYHSVTNLSGITGHHLALTGLVGEAPISVVSTTMCENLNVQYWSGLAMPELVNGKYLTTNGSTLAWYSGEVGTGTMGRLNDDINPTLAGNLITNGFNISSDSNLNIGANNTLTLNGVVSTDIYRLKLRTNLDANNTGIVNLKDINAGAQGVANSGKYLSSNGVDLSWNRLSPVIAFTPTCVEYPISNYVTLNTRAQTRPILEFDDTTNESGFFTDWWFEGHTPTGVLVRLCWQAATGTTNYSGWVNWNVGFEKITCLDSYNWGILKTVSGSGAGTSCIPIYSLLSFTGGDLNNLGTGEMFRMVVQRNNNIGDDMDLDCDAHLFGIEIRAI